MRKRILLASLLLLLIGLLTVLFNSRESFVCSLDTKSIEKQLDDSMLNQGISLNYKVISDKYINSDSIRRHISSHENNLNSFNLVIDTIEKQYEMFDSTYNDVIIRIARAKSVEMVVQLSQVADGLIKLMSNNTRTKLVAENTRNKIRKNIKLLTKLPLNKINKYRIVDVEIAIMDRKVVGRFLLSPNCELITW